MDIRFCSIDENCRYADEYCSSNGYCMINQDVYSSNPCGILRLSVEQAPE